MKRMLIAAAAAAVVVTSAGTASAGGRLFGSILPGDNEKVCASLQVNTLAGGGAQAIIANTDGSKLSMTPLVDVNGAGQAPTDYLAVLSIWELACDKATDRAFRAHHQFKSYHFYNSNTNGVTNFSVNTNAAW